MEDIESAGQLPKAVCGDCIAFRAESKDDQAGVLGKCRLRLELGIISSNRTTCHLFQIRADRLDKVEISVVESKSVKRTSKAPTFSTRSEKRTLRDPISGDPHGEIKMDREGLKQILRELLEEETLYGYPSINGRWEEGTLILKPENSDLQPKEIPLKIFFHKIVMLRDRLRVLEAKINGNDKLGEQEKLELQGYVSKCYGTLTTFNVLFSDKADHFKSK